MQPVILIADDERDAAELLGKLLTIYFPAALVRVAHGGRAALDSAQHQPPDIAILDLEMPELGGEELAALLRQTPREAPLHIVALSGDVMKLAALPGTGLFDCHLSKPVDTQQLVRVLKAQLNA